MPLKKLTKTKNCVFDNFFYSNFQNKSRQLWTSIHVNFPDFSSNPKNSQFSRQIKTMTHPIQNLLRFLKYDAIFKKFVNFQFLRISRQILKHRSFFNFLVKSQTTKLTYKNSTRRFDEIFEKMTQFRKFREFRVIFTW